MSARRRRLLVLGRGFDPEWPLHNLPDLQAWYTFDDADYLFTDAGSTNVTADGDKIYQCNDRSGNGLNLTQLTENKRPLWKVGVRHGRAIARGDAISTLLRSTPSGLLRDVAGATGIMVVKRDTAITSRVPFYIRDNTDDAARFCFLTDSADGTKLNVAAKPTDGDAAVPLSGASGLWTNQVWATIAARIDYAGGNGWLYYNNELVDSDTGMWGGANTSDTDPAAMAVCSHITGQNQLIGDYAEVIVCGSDIGVSQLTALYNNYLVRKWGAF